MTRPRIILHIGRNKAGSTTIQNALPASRPALDAAGIGYGLFGHLWDSDPALPGWQTFDALAAHAAADPRRTWLVSNEFMSAWPDAFTAEAGRALRDCDVRVIAYVRRYDHWLRSAYAEDVRSGANALDIDGFVATMAARASALPNLSGWARCFGWERMRVRGLAPAGLVGADLLTDFAAALALTTPLARIAARNVAPHWTAIETIRALVPLGLSDWAAATGPLAALIDGIARAVPDRPYLAPGQAVALRSLHAADLAVLRGFGQAIADDDEPGIDPARDAPPDFAAIPADVRDRLFAAAAAPAFAEAHPAAADAAAALRATAAAPPSR